MGDVEIDLQMLEDMCSELEEFAILLDKDHNIVWMNSLLRSSMNLTIKDCYTDSPKIKDYLTQHYNLTFDIITKSFQTGRLLKKIHAGKSKMTAMPIKYGAEVVYVLMMIDVAHVDDSLSSWVINHFVEDSKRLLLVVSGNHVVTISKSLDKIISNGPLRRFILDNFHDAQFLDNIREMMRYGYDISKKEILYNDNVAGYIYEFTKKAHIIKKSLRSVSNKHTKNPKKVIAKKLKGNIKR